MSGSAPWSLEPALASRPVPRSAWFERAARRVVHARLAGLSHGHLVVREPLGPLTFGEDAAAGGLRARVDVHGPGLYRSLAAGGIVGASESFVRGEWSCDDLASLVRLVLRNPALSDGLDSGLARVAGWPRRLRHARRRNHRAGSRRNIRAHYDLGNDFYEGFLDPTLTYSCGVFERPDATMEEASRAKYERMVRKLAIGSRDHVLEIGTGWGGFALHAAARTGCRITTTTLSRAQHERARERVAAAGLEDRVTVLLEDYRDLRGTYDKVVSIEMVEAVGHEYLGRFFETVCARLAPDGLMGLQAIVIGDRHYERARRTVDFIKAHVFPGGSLPSVAVVAEHLARRTDLRTLHLEDLTPHYAETLRRWRAGFRAARPALRARGYGDALLRLWEFYLGYCEGGFEERHIGLAQWVAARPGSRHTVPVAPLPAGDAPAIG